MELEAAAASSSAGPVVPQDGDVDPQVLQAAAAWAEFVVPQDEEADNDGLDPDMLAQQLQAKVGGLHRMGSWHHGLPQVWHQP